MEGKTAKEYPEMFDWTRLESPKLSAVAVRIAELLEEDLLTEARLLTPGLREALRQIFAQD